MKHLIRRLSKVADSSSSSTQFSIRRSNRRNHHRIHIPSICPTTRRVNNHNTVPAGHVPVYVGEEMIRFVVSAELMNHPIFVGLLNRSAQEYGYAQKGVLHIPCHVIVFERVVDTLRLGGFEESSSDELADLVASLPETTTE